MEQISIEATPSQIVKVVLDDQQAQLLIYQKNQGLMVDINVNGVDIVAAVIAQNENPLVCREYLGFRGNLLFVDTEGNQDPEYTGLGSRFNLIYLNEEEYDIIRK